MEKNKFSTMYRLQSSKLQKSPCNHKNMPIKRIIISDVGKITFNPDNNKHIYFSRTDKHHIYYIFNKVFKIIVEELNKSKNINAYKYIGLPDDLKEYFLYREIDWNIIKRVQNFFMNYLPPISVELVTIQYLNSFSQLVEKCHITNKRKKTLQAPEITDTSMFGGAYGISNAWLDLLKSATISTKTTNLYLDRFFEYYIANSAYRNSARASIRGILKHNPKFFEMLEHLTYSELNNPDFLAKNNANNIIIAINKIYRDKLYSQDASMRQKDFNEFKKQLRSEIEELKI